MDFSALKMVDQQKMRLDLNGDFDSLKWLDEHKDEIEDFIAENGALLIRGLNIADDGAFGEALKILFGEELIKYTYRSTPRSEINEKNVYSATEYHASEPILQHNENAYSNVWPMRIGFTCLIPADKMGNTPISDSRLAYKLIPTEIREEFERKGVMYVRNYSEIDLPWEEVFQTNDKAEVEHFCKNNALLFEWKPDGLRTKQINQATVMHPKTGEMVWFNQAHLFHSSGLNPEIREGLLELLGEENLPRNAYFGDGSPIDEAALAIIRQVFDDTKFSFQWQKGDLLLLDNMLFTHGREPYEGTRKVLVGMAKAYSKPSILI